MTENEFTLQDRLGVIRDTINKYGENKFYLSFSGGKDSTTLHYLLDMALPNNKIPRVYVNTGIEYLDVVDFVKELAKEDKRIVIITPMQSIKGTLEKYGYPFKSKEHAQTIGRYQKHIEETQLIFKEIEANKELLKDFDYIHNLPKNTKNSIKYFYGVRERERELYQFGTCP